MSKRETEEGGERPLVSLGVVCFSRSLAAIPSIGRAAESAGADFLAFADSPALAHDPFVAAATAAASTSSLRVGVGVVNPRTRHSAILANAAAGLAAASTRGAILGVGTGNSGIAPLGIPPAKVADVEETVVRGRRFLHDRAGRFDVEATNRVSFTIAGSGPRMLSLAGRIADEVWINVGVREEDLTTAAGWLAGSRRACRRWAFCVGSVDDDRDRARDAARGAAAALAYYVLGGELRRGSLRGPRAAAVAELVRQYQYEAHLEPGPNVNADICQALGIDDYVLNRFAICGTPADCVAAVRRLATSPTGVDGLCLSLSASPDLLHELDGWQEVFAAL